MDTRGSLIIYDLKGKIWLHIPDAKGSEGTLPEHPIPDGLPYIITKYGELDNKILKGVDVSVEPHKLITEDLPLTPEEELQQELLKAQTEIVDLNYKSLLNI